MKARVEGQDRVEKTMELKAPVSRVWRAVTNAKEFGQWFRAALDGDFVVGETVKGNITYEGYEHLRMAIVVESIEPERYFSFRWNSVDETGEEPDHHQTLVEITLEPIEGGTRLHLRESGFSTLPEDQRSEALRKNLEGWDIQAENIASYLAEDDQR